MCLVKRTDTRLRRLQKVVSHEEDKVPGVLYDVPSHRRVKIAIY